MAMNYYTYNVWDKDRREGHHYNLYHVTPVDNLATILEQGLSAGDDGYIYAFTDRRVADDIARDQLGMNRYALVILDGPGLTVIAAEPDNVGEFVHPCHVRFQCPRGIDAEHLYHGGIHETDPGHATEFQIDYYNETGTPAHVSQYPEDIREELNQ